MRDFELMIQDLKKQREDLERQMHSDEERQQETGKIFDRIRSLQERVRQSMIPGVPSKE